MTVSLVLLFLVYVVFLAVVSYRPTKRLGIRGWLLFLLVIWTFNNTIVLYGAKMFKTYFVHGGTIMSSSMFPTLSVEHADLIIVNKWLYKTPCRGDVVMCTLRGPLFDEKTLGRQVKRIVGLPGDTIDIQEPYVLVNGQKLIEPEIFTKISTLQQNYSGYYRAESMDLPTFLHDSIVSLPITLRPDEYFVLGDNSYYSADSRFIGPIRREDIHGRVVRIIYPISRFGLIE